MAEIIPIQPWGASADEWAHFDLVLGLGADLLPVVSNPRATISPDSHMAALGKTPSRYNAQRLVAGMAKWTQRTTTPNEIAHWARERDYGICIQTRRVRALDIDVDDADQARRLVGAIGLLAPGLPCRFRANSSKVLLAFELPGDYTKRRFKTAHGIVEFLATGQQFVAVGTHPSGARYEWAGGLPDDIPALTPEQFEDIWTALVAEFAIEAPSESSSSVKAQKLADVVALDATAQHLLDKGMVKRTERDGRLHITCPFEAEHTADSGDTATTYWPAHTGGYALGHFRCLHAHCEHRTDQDFRDAIGYEDEPMLGEFQAIADEKSPVEVGQDGAEDLSIDQGVPAEAGTPIVKPLRFAVQPAGEFSSGKPVEWLVKRLLPKAELGVLYGESGAGKSFAVLDVALAVAMGLPWRELRVRQGRVVYVAAEGAGGFRARLRAAAQVRGLELADLPLGVIADAPNLMEKADALAVAKSIVASGGADLVIVDTFAQVMAGGNENSGEDVGRVLAHCKGIHRATGAMVLLVHHSGKDSARGARGWSGIKGAVDVELEVVRVEDSRSLSVTKMKDGEGEGKEYAFRLESVVLGLDADGEELTSCVVSHGEGRVRGERKANGKPDWGAFLRRLRDDMQGLDGSGPSIHEFLAKAEETSGATRRVLGAALQSEAAAGRLDLAGGFVR